MENNVIEVKIWDNTVGLMYWDKKVRSAVFEYDGRFLKSGMDIAPTTMPIDSPRSKKGLPWTGNRDTLFQGLPSVFADSLPDKWGSALFNAWIESRHINAADISPVDKLAYIGSRGIGALEYVPAFNLGNDEASSIDLQELFEFAKTVLTQRKKEVLNSDQTLLWQDLIKIGTSAGGRRPKAMIAYNESSGEIRSGQTLAPEGFEQYILKFDEQLDFPFSRVEYAYALLAQKAGITMMPCRLLDCGTQHHFMTLRFDRINNTKIHTQTQAAMNPQTISYEDIFRTMRRLNLSASEFSEQFRRMVFNVYGCNMDDHNKNFSFQMDPSGKWSLSPAYDLTFCIDISGPDFMNRHEMSINGKNKDISHADLEKIAKENDIDSYQEIIECVQEAFSTFREIAGTLDIQPLIIKQLEHQIQKR
jgi:serine/threonine-protein kinase HipA